VFARLYFDRHIMARLAENLRGRGYDGLTTEAAGQDTATDELLRATMSTSNAPVLPLVLTTETPEGRRESWFVFLFFALIGVIWAVAILYFGPRPLDRQAVAIAGLLTISPMVVGLLVFWYRGTWTFSSSGITYEPLIGRPRHLRWDAIDRVRLPQGAFTTLQGDGITISIHWHMLPEEAAEQGRAAIEKILGQDFNLAMKPVEEDEPKYLRGGPWHEQAIGLLKLTAFGIVIGAGWMAVTTAILIGLDRQPLGYWLGMTWLTIWILPVALWTWRVQRRRERINPAWRYRRLD
jgi:hypothetical protein